MLRDCEIRHVLAEADSENERISQIMDHQVRRSHPKVMRRTLVKYFNVHCVIYISGLKHLETAEGP